MGGDEVVEAVKFPGEGDVAEVTEEGHFEDVKELGAGGVIDPFRVGVEVPHFPEETAEE
ncbi:MAG: hypothetical protein RI897_3975 [Verrucomicrobiota bacterium]